MPPQKNAFISSIFGRRRSRRGGLGDNAAARRQLKISSPYNFQHFIHTKREHLPSLKRDDYTELVTDFSAIFAGRWLNITGFFKDTDADRPLSGESDTLGRFNMFPAQNTLNQVVKIDDVVDESHRGGWEDDIDYCYERGAEASCDYVWDRPFDQTSIRTR